MVNEQILSYIRQNLQAGFQMPDIEIALRSAGWSDEDITAGFAALKSAPQKTPLTAHQTQDQKAANAEIHRIEEQSKRAVERATTQISNQKEVGIYGFLLRNNFASSKQSANVLFVAGIVFVIVLLYWIFLR